MKALILLGGLGTRLRPFTLSKPKPLLPILNRPFISYQIEQLKAHGIRDVVLALGYHSAHFRKHLGNGRQWGMRFTYSFEKTPLGTGGAIRNALRYLEGTTVILNGDVLSDFNLSEIVRWHRKKKALGTLTLVRVKDPSSFGLIETLRNGKIRRFLEKPSAEEVTVDTINAGCYVFEPAVVKMIPEGRAVSIEREVFPKLVQEGHPLYGYLYDGYWSDIGTLKTYWENHMTLLKRWVSRDSASVRKIRDGVWGEAGCVVSRDVKVQGRVLMGKACRIAAGAVFRGNVCIGDRCVIDENVVLSDCVIHSDTHIGRHSQIEKSLIGEKSVVYEQCHVGPNEVLANGSRLNPYSRQIPGLAGNVNG
jgi:NDP-sugar pyrophosphorylase family protein